MPKLQKIPVDALRIGMYVARLDRDWLDTPFLFQGFPIADHDDVRVVAQYCDEVWIDVEQTRGSDHSSNEGTAKSKPAEPIVHEVLAEQEHKRINEGFKQARELTRDLLDDVRLGRQIDSAAVTDTVDDCVSSVLRNPDALVWMSKIREESEYTAEHSLNVCILAVVFGRHLGLQKNELETVGLCGLLHDIGKVRVPMEILEKPGPLTTKEMNMMKAHTVHGRNLLLQTPSIDPIVIDVAYSHHERIDSKGYPRKIDASAISRYVRMVSIVDAYDAITANRCYSRARSSTTALKVLYEERGTQFDSELVLQFIKIIGLFPVGSVVELYSGEIGIVVETNQRLRHLPRVLVVMDKHCQPKERYKIVDLVHIEEGDLPSDFLIKKVLPDGTHGVHLRKYQEEGVLLNYS